MRLNRFQILCLAVCLAVWGCGKPADDSSIPVGGLYASQDADGTWRVTKVIAVDDDAVHLRVYANKFREPPKDVDPAKLTLGSIYDPGGFGIGHFPMAKEGFLRDYPVFLKVVPVAENELEGYRMYLDAMKAERPN